MRSRELALGPLRIRFHWLIASAVIAATAGLIRLGIWQLDRAEEKQQLIDAIHQRQQQDAVDIGQLVGGLAHYSRDQLDNLAVMADGEYLNDKTFFLTFQSYESQVGYEVITPFKLNGSGDTVLVSRGWVRPEVFRDLSLLTTVEGQQHITGLIHIPPDDVAKHSNNLPIDNPETIQWPLEIRYANVSELGYYLGESLFPYVVRLNEGAPGVLIRYWRTVTIDTGMNISYAFQWFAMATAVVIVSLVLSSNILSLARERFGGNER